MQIAHVEIAQGIAVAAALNRWIRKSRNRDQQDQGDTDTTQ
jgi:hypothetical protein